MLQGLLVILAISSLGYVECRSLVNPSEWRQLSKVGDIWSDCGKPGDHAKINNVSIVPDPPKIGETVTISATLTSDEVITGGKVNVQVTYNGFPFEKSYGLCDLTKKVNYPCPLKKGQVHVSLPVKVPSIAPKGNYKGKVTATDQNGVELGCIALQLTLG